MWLRLAVFQAAVADADARRHYGTDGKRCIILALPADGQIAVPLKYAQGVKTHAPFQFKSLYSPLMP